MATVSKWFMGTGDANKPAQKWSKALNGIQWEVAHPLTLNYGAPIASMDATICVSVEGTPYVGITKGFKCVMYLLGTQSRGRL